MNSELRDFVSQALSRGMPRATIRETLLAAGWRPEEAQAALDGFADIDSPIPVPRRRPYLSARETFFYLVLFVTLYLTAINVGSVLFQLVNRAIPDVGTSAWDRFSAQAARGAVAGIVIAFPIFLFMSRLVGRTIAREPEKRSSKIRKWLTYITLFVTACVIIGDLTFLLNQVLSGELVLRIGLKAMVVLLIAGVIFVHYLSDLRGEEEKANLAPAKPSWLARSAGVATLATVVAGLFLVGSPWQERRRAVDGQRVADLSRISGAVTMYYQEHSTLPESLGVVAALPSSSIGRAIDPASGEPYGYRIVDSTAYELSAVFDTADSTVGEGMPSPFWRHGSGRQTYRIATPGKEPESPRRVVEVP